MSLVQVHDLERWGKTVDARDRLGRLLGMLVRATLSPDDLRTVRFLHGVATQLPGWDGIVDAAAPNEYVPEGKSVWELGTGSGDAAKIRSDFAKRVDGELPDGWQHVDTTYIAVSLSKLQDTGAQVEKLGEGSPWKAIKIIDVVGLAHWLDLSAAVDIWAFEQVNRQSADGIQTLAWAWEQWAGITKPTMQPNLVAAAREPDIARVCEAIVAGSGLQIDADSPDEGVAFVYAAMNRLPEGQRDSVMSRALVISKTDAAQRFPRSTVPQFLVLKGDATLFALRFEGEGHQVIRVHGKNAHSRRTGLVLARQPRREFAQALHSMGIVETKAEIEARACGSSASVWRIWNLINEANAAAILPAWAGVQHSEIVIPAVLLGGWSERSQHDIAVVEAVSNRPYEEFRDRLMQINSQDEPLVEVAGDTVVVAAPATAFAVIAKAVGRGNIQRFMGQAAAVFAEIDPQIDVEPSERMYAGMDGQRLLHSEWLRDGAAGTLLRIAVLGEALEESGALGPGTRRQQFVDNFIRGLPGLRDNYRLIASLRDQLPVLAEAAPIPFLEALETLLQGDRDGLTRLFAEGGDFGGYALYPGLLWALETLAWNADLLGRVVQVLAGLDSLDPGGRLSNRPLESLADIFLPWNPGTAASIQERIDALVALVDRYSDGGWKLLMQLMPNARRVSSGTHSPEWRECARAAGAPISRKDVAQLYSAYIDVAISRAAGRADRLGELVRAYPGFSPEHRDAIEQTISQAVQDMAPDEMEPVWEALRNLIARHREFPDAAWVLDQGALDRLQALCDRMQPSDLLLRHAWLFQDNLPDLPVPRTDHAVYALEVERRRAAAIREIWAGPNRVDKLIALAEKSGYPGFVAISLAAIESNFDVLLDIFRRTVRGERATRIFATALSGESYSRFDHKWTEAILALAKSEARPSEVAVAALLGYPDSLSHFKFVSGLGGDIEKEFWTRHYGFIRRDDDAAARYAVDKLVQYGRARDALMLIAGGRFGLSSAETLNILNATWIELNGGLRPRLTASISYWIEQVLDRLREDPGVDRHEVARAEYKYLPLLVQGIEKKELVLHEILASDPRFFIEVVCDLYKPESSEREDDGRSKEEREARAHFAWDLLRSWKTPPGIAKEGTVDPTAMAKWIHDVRQLAVKVDRATIVDQQIGHILFHAPADPDDNAWPHRHVRSLIEDLRNDEVEIGIRTEQYNSRGITSRGVYDGGAQERDLAKRWREWADAIGPRWPRTQAMLIKIAEQWVAEAEREDVDARKNELRYR